MRFLVVVLLVLVTGCASGTGKSSFEETLRGNAGNAFENGEYGKAAGLYLNLLEQDEHHQLLHHQLHRAADDDHHPLHERSKKNRNVFLDMHELEIHWMFEQ